MQLALRLKLCLRTFCVFVLLPVSFCQPTPFLRILLVPVDPQRRGAQGPAFYARRGKREFITPVVSGIS
jgi:hypothetical protein